VDRKQLGTVVDLVAFELGLRHTAAVALTRAEITTIKRLATNDDSGRIGRRQAHAIEEALRARGIFTLPGLAVAKPHERILVTRDARLGTRLLTQ
jgi:hypothetical protein